VCVACKHADSSSKHSRGAAREAWIKATHSREWAEHSRSSYITPPRLGAGKCVRKHVEVAGSVKRVVKA
jgi:hypothetical protein